MWLAKQAAQGRQRQPVSVQGAQMGELYPLGEFEYRELPSCGPYGIYSRPPHKTDLMVLSTDGGKACIGAVTEPGEQPGLEPGEVLIRSAGGAEIKLCADGSILLNGLRISKSGQMQG